MDHPVSENIRGLTLREAEMRLRQYGKNVFFEKKEKHPFFIFLEKFKSPLLLILIGASFISFFVGERTNGLIILVMVIISGILDFVNTYKSEKAVAELVAKVRTTATVVRDGKDREVGISEIVPGDIVLLSAGNIIPADGTVIEAKDFFVNQSSLTGESFPIQKTSAEEDKNAPLFENKKRVFSGSSVATGYAVVEIVTTGTSTEFGKIASHLQMSPPETDFEKGIRRFSFFILRITTILVALVFLGNTLLGRGAFSSFIFAVAIAIGLTPELLPIIMTVTMSRGSVRMAKKDVIVKTLSSIQSLGEMNIICTDKTGTLTEDKIVLMKYMDGFGNPDEKMSLYSYLSSHFHTGIRSPLDTAIREYKEINIDSFRKIDEIPFDFERKKDSIVVEESGERILITKGAPEDVLRISSTYITHTMSSPLDEESRKSILGQFTKLSAEGFRVLAVASRHIEKKDIYEKEDEQNMEFLGFAVFLDPPKLTAKQAVKDLVTLGIEIKILTGDSEVLTQKICRDLDISVKGVCTGREIEKMNDEVFLKQVRINTIFARISPIQKERIILALKSDGNSVGYLGDGINDAPALRAADVGISVHNAVDIAKETADIILLRKSLRVLRDGVTEGRKTFQNTMKYIMMGLSSNFGNMVSMTTISFFLPFFPMLPTQILLNNFLYDTSQLALPTDSVDAGDVQKPPRWDMKFVGRYMIIFGLLGSFFDFATFGILLFIFHFSGSEFQTGWFMASLAEQILVIYVIRTKKIPFFQSAPSVTLFLNTFFLFLFSWILPYTAIGKIFSFSPLPPTVFVALVSLLLMYLLCAEFIKHVFYRRYGTSRL